MSKFKELISPHKNLIIYILIGILGAIVDLVVFSLLVGVFKLSPPIANIFSSIAGIINNFFFNAIYNFQKKDKLSSRFAKFFSIAIGGILLGSSIIYLLTQIFAVNPVIAKGISLIIVMILQYNLNKKVSFK